MPKSQLSRVTRWGTVAVVIVAIAAAMAAATLASRKPKHGHISARSALVLPSARVCVSRHRLTFRLRGLAHVRWRKITVSVNRRHFETIELSGKRSRHPRPVKLRKLPAGTFVLRVTAHSTDGRHVAAKRRYRTCAPEHRLRVVLAGTGSGAVSGGGIACPGTCSRKYKAGSTVTLTASPRAGSSFGGWSGGGCSGSGSCTLKMTSNRSVTATFTANPPSTHMLSVSLAGSGSGTVSGSGISCPGTCSHGYTAGSSVTLTASPASGSSFGGWSGGGCSGTGACTVTMGSDEAVAATFTANPPSTYTLSVSLVGSGSGTVTGSGISCPGTCSQSYTSGSTVVLYAAAAGGSTFAGWTGAACEGTAFCVVNMGKAQNVTATFQTVSPSTLTVDTWGSGSGSVTSKDGGIDCPGTCSASYAYGTQVTLTAAAVAGSTFVGWSGGGCQGTGTCIVTADSAQHVTATFQKVPVASETPGAYTGKTVGSCCSSIYFYVSPDGGSIENVDIPSFSPSCTPSGSVSPAYVGISSIPINSDGSLSSTTTQSGLVDNQPATFTYTFDGQFSSPSALTGTWREDVTYANNGTSYSCTTGNVSYTASWNTGQTNQNSATASPGSYTGYTERSCCSSIYFYVSPDGGSIENVDIPSFSPSCTPSGSVSPAYVGISSIPINSDGSFSSTTTQSGLVDNQPATFTYTFDGYVHGPNGSGDTVMTGIWREDVTYANNGIGYSCTTNNESFYATLDGSQTNQNSATASPGTYTGYTERSCCSSIHFTVASGSSTIDNVSIPSTSLACSPAEPNLSSAVTIASIPINSDGSFSSTTTQTGLVGNQPATITFTFDGYVHGPNTSGDSRINGIWREDITYADNGTSYYCTTNNQSYRAVWTSG